MTHNILILEYLILVCFFIWLIPLIYIKIKYPFWSHQPVLHTYDMLRYYYSSYQWRPYIIRNRLPLKGRYFSTNISTNKFLDISKEALSKVVDFLQSHYVESDMVLTMITQEIMEQDLSGVLTPSLISLMKEKQLDYMTSASGLVPQEREVLVGCMTSRCTRLFVIHNSLSFQEKTYFWDHICTHRKHSHRYLGRNLIQTHEYYQRLHNHDIKSSVFKREGNVCDGIIPIMQYRIQTFPIVYIKRPPLHPLTLVKIEQSNTSLLHDFLYNMTHKIQQAPFQVCIFPEMDVLDNLLQKGRLHIYALTYQSKVSAIYFLKDPHMYYQVEENERRIVECVASIKSVFLQDDGVFFAGFLHALHEMQNQDTFELVTFHETSHNDLITERWKWKYRSLSVSDAAYYAHNMVIPGMPFHPRNCFVIT